MKLLPDTDLRLAGNGRVPPLTMALLMEAFRQGCDIDLACEVVGYVVTEMQDQPATPRTLLVGVNLLTARIEEKRPF